MATHKQPQINKTYATEANAHKAVNSVDWIRDGSDLTYFIQPVLVGDKIRYGVIFYGVSAFNAGVHFHFNIVG